MPERSADAAIPSLVVGNPNEKTLNEAENDAITLTAFAVQGGFSRTMTCFRILRELPNGSGVCEERSSIKD